MRSEQTKTALAAVALGAASVFLSQWDPEDHWATPEPAVVTIIEQLDDDDWVDAPPHWGRVDDGTAWTSLG